MKKLYSFITIAILASFAGLTASAQPGVGATYIGDYSKMSSRSAMDKEMENGNWAYRMKNLKSGRYDFTVTMKDGPVKTVKSKIYADSLKNQSYLVYTDAGGQSQKIYSGETSKISYTNGGTTVEGTVGENYWLFPIAKGKINLYSFFPVADGPYSLIATQIGSGPTQLFDPETIGAIVKGDDQAYKAFVKKNYLKAIERFNESPAPMN